MIEAEEGYVIQVGDLVGIYYCGNLVQHYPVTRVTDKRVYVRFNDSYEEYGSRIYTASCGWRLGAYSRGRSYRIFPQSLQTSDDVVGLVK